MNLIPYWIDLPNNVRVFVRPLSTAMYEQARAWSSRLVAEILEDREAVERIGGVVEGLPDIEDPDGRSALFQLLFAQGLAKAAIIKWEGVLDPSGDGAEIHESSVCQLMMIHSMAESFVAEYTKTHEELLSEGNVLRPSPNGNSEEGLNTVKAAGLTGCLVRLGDAIKAVNAAQALKTCPTPKRVRKFGIWFCGLLASYVLLAWAVWSASTWQPLLNWLKSLSTI